MKKVSVIEQEIGVKPVLCFGNSSGDEAMANFTINNNTYKSAAYMLCCDDTQRENGYISISMKNDWKTIYGDNVTKK